MYKLIFLFFFFSINLFAQINFTLFHTNDLHSHLEGVKIYDPKTDKTHKVGGYDKLAHAIKKIRRERSNQIVIGIDAGDFFSGTIFSSLAPSLEKDFPEFDFFNDLKFDVVGLGNHEFDSRNIGLERMFTKIAALKSTTAMISSNLKIKDVNSPLFPFVGNKSLIKNYLVKEYNTPQGKINILFLAVVGPDACLVSKGTRGDISFVGFNDDRSKIKISELIDHLNELVSAIQSKEKIDLVVLSMHGGGNEAKKILENVPAINILIAGHTHDKEFYEINGRYLSQTGSYGMFLGLMDFSFDKNTNKLKLLNPKSLLISIEDEKESDRPWKKKIEQYKKKSLNIMGENINNSDKIVFKSCQTLEHKTELFNPLGIELSSRILSEMNKDKLEVDFYFTTLGLIRDSLIKGKEYTVPDIFEFVSIGFDQKLVPGIETVVTYLTTEEVIRLINFLEVYSHISGNVTPAFSSNLTYRLNKYGIPFLNRIKDVSLNGKKIGQYNRLIKVGTNKFVLDNISLVKSSTYGLIKIEPKNAMGVIDYNYELHSKEYKFLTRSFSSKTGSICTP